MNTLILHLGNNLGERKIVIEQAMALIEKKVGAITDHSSYYETEPWLGPDPSSLSEKARQQANFLNIALKVEVEIDPHTALSKCMEIEEILGRERKERWGARMIDIDLIFYDNQAIQSPDLTIPHPWMHERRFVLLPVAELIPNWIHPILKKNILKLLEECEDDGWVRKL